MRAYADKLLDTLDPSGDLFTNRMYREHCTPLEGCYTKDLRLLGRDLAHTVLVENTPLSFCLQPGNAILVPTWLSDETDSELLNLITLLDELSSAPDVRPLRSLTPTSTLAPTLTLTSSHCSMSSRAH